jgi:hypothetical protein
VPAVELKERGMRGCEGAGRLIVDDFKPDRSLCLANVQRRLKSSVISNVTAFTACEAADFLPRCAI